MRIALLLKETMTVKKKFKKNKNKIKIKKTIILLRGVKCNFIEEKKLA